MPDRSVVSSKRIDGACSAADDWAETTEAVVPVDPGFVCALMVPGAANIPARAKSVMRRLILSGLQRSSPLFAPDGLWSNRRASWNARAQRGCDSPKRARVRCGSRRKCAALLRAPRTSRAPGGEPRLARRAERSEWVDCRALSRNRNHPSLRAPFRVLLHLRAHLRFRDARKQERSS